MIWNTFINKLEGRLERLGIERNRMPSEPVTGEPGDEAEFAVLLYDQAGKMETLWGDIKKSCREFLEQAYPLSVDEFGELVANVAENDLYRVNHYPKGLPDKAHFHRWLEMNEPDLFKQYQAYEKLRKKRAKLHQKQSSGITITLKHYPDSPELERNQ